MYLFFFFKQKTAYEMRISDWSSDVCSSDLFIAQTYVPTSNRLVRVDGETVARKMDVRLYTYCGELLLVASRLYQGQTTNMRTPGRGFVPVLLIRLPTGYMPDGLLLAPVCPACNTPHSCKHHRPFSRGWDPY